MSALDPPASAAVPAATARAVPARTCVTRTAPPAMTVILVLGMLILPPLVIGGFIPAEALSLTAAVVQACVAVFVHVGIQFLTPNVGLAVVFASLVGFMTWLSGPSKSLLQHVDTVVRA
jgi:hypothetical protein